MIINLINKNLAKVLLYMAISPGRKHTRKELKIWTKMNNVPMDDSINKLLNLGIIEKNNNLYSLNLDNNIVSKIIEEIKELSDELARLINDIMLDKSLNSSGKITEAQSVIQSLTEYLVDLSYELQNK